MIFHPCRRCSFPWRRLIAWAALSLVALPSAPVASAKVKPHALFTDGAVLQQGQEIPVWGTADAGEAVTVKLAGQERKTTAKDGRWQVEFDKLPAGGPHELLIECTHEKIAVRDVHIGEVWVASGQSNMQWPMSASADPEKNIAGANNPYLRLFTVPRLATDQPQSDVDARWAVCSPDAVKDFSAVAYYFGRHLQNELGVAVGMINTSYGGTPAEAWTSRQKLLSLDLFKPLVDQDDALIAGFPEAQAKYKEELAKWEQAAKEAEAAGGTKPEKPKPPVGPGNPHRPCGLYNAMIHPLVPYAVRGAIWYQGESNAGRAWEYRSLLPAMILSWREAWGQGEFPFYIVQLAPFQKIVDQPGDSAWAELREAQLLTSLHVNESGLAVITDVGDEKDIHPKQKEPVGTRLALWALAKEYGKAIEYSGPLYQNQQVAGDKIALGFSHVGEGLEARGGKLTGFAICGADGKFVNADAAIEADKVIVSSPAVKQPTAVRYGWANYPLGNLWNKNGLPASPFRTDDFPLTTAPKK